MVAIPISMDQPGVAARIAWTGTGEVMPLSRLSSFKLRETVTKVLTQESYKINAVRLQQALHDAGGVSRTVNIIGLTHCTNESCCAATQMRRFSLS